MSNTTIGPFTRDMCIKGCNSNPSFNTVLNCGPFTNPIMALAAGEPESARCLLNIKEAKQLCIERCSRIREVKTSGPIVPSTVPSTPLDLTIPSQQPVPEVEIVNWTNSGISETDIPKWASMGFTLPDAVEFRSNNITPEQAAGIIQDATTNGEWHAINFNGTTLHNEKMDWGYAVKWKTKRWGWHITPFHNPDHHGEVQVDSCWYNNPHAIIDDAKQYIADQIGVPIYRIAAVEFPPSGRGVGNITPVGCRWRVVWEYYEFKYLLLPSAPVTPSPQSHSVPININTHRFNPSYSISTPFNNHNDYLRYSIYCSDRCQYMKDQEFKNALWNMASNLVDFCGDGQVRLSGRWREIPGNHVPGQTSYKLFLEHASEQLMTNLTEDHYLKIFGALFKMYNGDNYKEQFKLWLRNDYGFHVKIDNLNLSLDDDVSEMLFPSL